MVFNQIRQRIRDKHGKHVGLMVAIKLSNTLITVGWSVCNKIDKYDKQLADKIAFNRAMYGSHTPAPRFAKPQIDKFSQRATFYFTNPNPKPKRAKAI